MSDDMMSRNQSGNWPEFVLIFTPSLTALLLNKEKAKGSPLTIDEVHAIRDSARVVEVSPEIAAEFEKKRGYQDIDAENCWDEWQRLRLELQKATTDNAAEQD